MTTIKAIETQYNGYRFRSRLEARWATFFDAMGVKYQYESEGFQLGNIWYLPDFYLDTWDCFFEVKPYFDLARTSVSELAKIDAFARNADTYLLLGLGTPGDRDINLVIPNPRGSTMHDIGIWVCSGCGRMYGSSGYIQIQLFAPRYKRKKSAKTNPNDWDTWCEPCDQRLDIDQEIGWKRQIEAENIARSARFEHGEKPKVTHASI